MLYQMSDKPSHSYSHRIPLQIKYNNIFQLGEWSYTLQGQGMRPAVMDPVNISCPLGQVTQTLLPFKNPLDHPITVSCKLLERNKIEHKGLCVPIFLSAAYRFSRVVEV